MNKEDLIWLRGFFEGQASFSVLIELNKKTTSVIFRPCIVIASTDSRQIAYIKKLLELQTYSTRKKKLSTAHKQAFSLNIQNSDDIENILGILDDYEFKSKKKNESFIRFKICLKHLSELGHMWKTWDDNIEVLIEEKLKINQKRGGIDKNRFGLNEWKKKIKEHFV